MPAIVDVNEVTVNFFHNSDADCRVHGKAQEDGPRSNTKSRQYVTQNANTPPNLVSTKGLPCATIGWRIGSFVAALIYGMSDKSQISPNYIFRRSGVSCGQGGRAFSIIIPATKEHTLFRISFTAEPTPEQ
jgi:hypothetical protein